MSRILLVGGAGYIGSVLADELLTRGYSVRVFDRLYFGDMGIRHIRDRVDLVVGDMRDMEASAFEDIQAVVNVGGLSNDPTAGDNPKAHAEMNTVASPALAETAWGPGGRRVAFASSALGDDVRVSG